LESRLHAVEHLASEGQGRPAQFIPIRFIFRNKLTRDDRLLVAFDALVLSELLGRDVNLGKIIHGDDYGTLEVKTASLLGEVRKLAANIAEFVGSSSPRDLVMNRHCGECEFRDWCRRKAVEKDDLSLLANMTEKERKNFHNKGIFTVTQLSYTFRPRRRPKRLRDKREKYHHSLKALAIREKKIHIVGSPELKIQGTPVYLDVEGLPDRDFYYLVGVQIGNGESAVRHSLWADTVADEGRVWREFLAILETVEKPVVVHYGSFEKTFWRRMGERHGEPAEGSKPSKAISSAINLVSFFFAQIYFPTYSNHLKDIASWRGFSWSDPSLFGPNSVVCRSEWEASGDPLRKQRLITYNTDDCKALETLACFTSGVCQCESTGTTQPNSNVVVVDKLKPLKRFILINKDGAALPEFKEINKAAYWDYQRQRVYVRSSKVIRKASQGMLKGKARSLPVQGTIKYPVPSSCPRCGGVDLDLKGKTTLLTYDAKFMRSGVKGLVRRQVWPRYYCAQCQQLVRPDGTQFFTIRKYGLHLRAYAINQLVELRISGAKVAKSLNQIFHFELTGSLVSTFKSDFAKMYGDTVKGLTDRMVTGSLVHADETQARMVGKSGYVWVLSSLEEVVYLYSDSREGDMIWSLLENFRGVLVSDFYAVYDSIKCPQQKCLIHLMRDINDDLHKYPFDEDLRKIAQAFAGLLKPMVETIDKHGLKKHFLSKYVVAVEKYYSWLAQAHFASEVAAGYEKRFSKYRDKLFTFLRHNNVPWNNNNAENAIRAFGELRDIIKGVTTEKGLREYLVLLSICETCKRRGISFIDFLCSGEIDLERFAGAKSIASKRVTRQRRSEAAASPPQEPVQKAAPAIPKSSGGQPASRDQWHAQHEREILQKELDAWSRFTCPGHVPWPEIADPLVRLERYDGMPSGGALAALPALVESGLAAVDQLFPTTVGRSLQEVAMALIALASVSRTPSVEALQLLAPAGWKKVLFSERLPDNRTVAELIKLICSAPSNIARWKAHCVGRFLAKMSRLDGLLSVNGCRRLYADGERASSGSESARRMLLARCIGEPWVQALKGRPFFLVCGDLSSDRRSWLSKRIFSSSQGELGELRMGKMQAMLLNQDRVTVIFGAGGLFPAFFERLFKMGHHVLSYLLSEESPWPDSEFRSQDVKLLSGQTTRLQFAERALPLADGVHFRELRCLTTDSRQIGVISSDRELDLKALAGSLMVKFSAVRFLDYLRVHSALDGLCEGILDPTQEKAKAGNEGVTPRSFRAFGPHHAVREFLNAIKLISFRAENMMAQIIRERVSQPDKVVLMLRDLLSSPADMVPNLKHETLTVRLHPQILDGCEEALRHLCSELNPTETVFPATDLRLVYEVASPG
jgi:predicted RecB family nuclease